MLYHVSHTASTTKMIKLLTHSYPAPLIHSTQIIPKHHIATQNIMGYTTHRRSSVHYTAEATLGIRIGIARRVSYAERSSKASSSSSSSSSHHGNNDKTKTRSSPYYHHHTLTPDPSPVYTSLHAFCIATEATYARLSARLDRLRGHKAAVAFYVKEEGKKGLGQVLESLRDDVGKLERVLEGMRWKIEKGEDGCGWDGSGKAFLVGGRWATFL